MHIVRLACREIIFFRNGAMSVIGKAKLSPSRVVKSGHFQGGEKTNASQGWKKSFIRLTLKKKQKNLKRFLVKTSVKRRMISQKKLENFPVKTSLLLVTPTFNASFYLTVAKFARSLESHPNMTRLRLTLLSHWKVFEVFCESTPSV